MLNCLYSERWRKDGKNLDRVIDTYSTMLLRIAYHYVNEEDAKDLVQDTLIQYMNKADHFTNEEHEKAWLIRTITNLCKNNIKHWWKSKRVNLPEFIVASPKIKNDSMLDEIRKLSINQSSVIYLHYYEGYSTKEIANLLNMNENTVLSHLKRGKEKLRKQLKGVNFDE